MSKSRYDHDLASFDDKIKALDAAIEVMKGRGSTEALENEKTRLILGKGSYVRECCNNSFRGIGD